MSGLVKTVLCCIMYDMRICQHRWRKLLGWAGCGPPTFWPLWAGPISGQPIFDSQGPRKSVKVTHNYIFTSWIPEKHPTRWLLWHSDITKFNSADHTGGAYNAPPGSLVGWGGDTPSPFPTSIDLWRRGSSVTGPPTFQMLPPPMHVSSS